MKVELKGWQALAMLTVVLAAPHLSANVAALFCYTAVIMAVIDYFSDKREARDEP